LKLKILKVIPARVWKHNTTGETASIHGAMPYFMTGSENWEIVQVGYTWVLDNGTIGLGRKPAKTLQEAEEIMRKFNERQK
jgi:hypothetical protein